MTLRLFKNQTMGRARRSRHLARILTAGTLLGGGAVASSVPASAAAATGSMTVLLPASTYGGWTGLDPATLTTSAENWDILNAIYGELFQQGPNGTILPDLATGYMISKDGLTVTIKLRDGVNFSDGTPLNAAAVVSDYTRDFSKAAACICDTAFAAVTSVSAIGDDKVVLHLSQRDTAIIDSLFTEAPNWIYSPTALAKEGASFALDPVGAGPYEVVKATPNTTVELQANPTYWQAGHPKLASLTFTSIGTDTSAYEALQAGSANAYLGLATTGIVTEAQKGPSLRVTKAPATAIYSVPLNPYLAPFNNIKAREAIYYALDPVALDKAIFGGTSTLAQSPAGPADLFYSPNVPGYRTYNLAKAKALVKQLGGLSFTLSGTNSPYNIAISEAEASEWEAAGIDVKINLTTLPQVLELQKNGGMQAESTGVGSYSPALAPGVAFKFSSTGAGSLVRDKVLDAKISAAEAEADQGKALAMYKAIYSYINEKAYAPFLFTNQFFDLTDKSVAGIDGTVPEIQWQNVGLNG
jgi:peptide/nickel transport system substrate-binding protein